MQLTALLIIVFPLVWSDTEKRPNVNGAKAVRLFNTDVLGKGVGGPVQLLSPVKSETIDPATVQVDVKDGKFFAATIAYPAEVGFRRLKTALDRDFKKYQSQFVENENGSMCIYRNTDAKFTIQLSAFPNTEYIRVVYIEFQRFDETEFLKRITDAAKQVEEEEANDGGEDR